jgi:protein TonB
MPATAATTPAAGEPAATASVASSIASGHGAGAASVAGPDGGASLGQGGSGSGGGQGAGLGARQGSGLALAVPGDGGGDAAEYEGYYALVRSRLHEILRYPTVARRRGLTGRVEVEVDIAPSGVVGATALVASSSHRLLDDAALEAAQALGRVPFPPGVRPRPLRMRLPVVFVLR